MQWGPEVEGVATVVMQGRPANTLGMETCRELRDTLRSLSQDSSCKGIILSSGIPKIFSAGLDLGEVLGDDHERMIGFLRSLLDLFITGYTGVHKPMVAQIDGAAPAGGCMVALFADARVVSRSSTIGLNEARVGLPVPPWLALALQACIGSRYAEQHVARGLLLGSSEAQRIGLVDRIADSPEQLRAAALEELSTLMEVNPDPQHRSRLIFRS